MRRRAAAALAVLAVAGPAGCAGAAPRADRAPRPLRVSVTQDGRPAEIATGVAAGDGRVLTVAHVLAGGGRARVAGLPATVLRLDERLDLAVLAVPGLRARGLRLAPSAGGVALRVLRDGRPRTVRAAVRRTVIAHVREAPGEPVRTRPGLELAAHVVAGDSGAPVTDAEGRVVGVVFASSRDCADTAWAVGAAAVRALLRR